MAPTAHIGQIVRYHSGGADEVGSAEDSFIEAAIVTMTAQEWQPGYRQPDGTWVETKDVTQPKAGTVHLHLFVPPGIVTTAVDYKDVPYGTTHGCWSEVSP